METSSSPVVANDSSPDSNNAAPSNNMIRIVAALGFASGLALAVSSSSSQITQFAPELLQAAQVGESIERMLSTGGLPEFFGAAALVGIIIGAFVNGIRK